MMGVYRRLGFNPKDSAVGTILQWQRGKRVVVYPKSIATGKTKPPPWMKK